MKFALFIVVSYMSNVLFSQNYPDYNDGHKRVIFEPGIGFASIGGIAFLNELAVNYKKNTIAARVNLSSELGSKSNGRSTNDYWMDCALTYGRMKTLSKSYIELNVGPSYYGYFDKHIGSSSWFGGSSVGVKTKEYTGLGGLLSIDYGRDFNQRIGLTYSLFFQINRDFPLMGLLIKLNLRSVP